MKQTKETNTGNKQKINTKVPHKGRKQRTQRKNKTKELTTKKDK